PGPWIPWGWREVSFCARIIQCCDGRGRRSPPVHRICGYRSARMGVGLGTQDSGSAAVYWSVFGGNSHGFGRDIVVKKLSANNYPDRPGDKRDASSRHFGTNAAADQQAPPDG